MSLPASVSLACDFRAPSMSQGPAASPAPAVSPAPSVFPAPSVSTAPAVFPALSTSPALSASPAPAASPAPTVSATPSVSLPLQPLPRDGAASGAADPAAATSAPNATSAAGGAPASVGRAARRQARGEAGPADNANASPGAPDPAGRSPARSPARAPERSGGRTSSGTAQAAHAAAQAAAHGTAHRAGLLPEKLRSGLAMDQGRDQGRGQGMATAVAAGRRGETARRFAVRLVFILFALSLVEGALRKWVAPGLAAELYLLRDPVVLLLYAHALAHGLFSRDALAASWLVLAATSSLFGGIAYVAEGLSPVAFAFGVRNYWLYMPLMFVVAATFRAADVVALLRLNLVVAMPCAALVVIQSRAGPSAWINKGIAADGPVATVAGGIVRPYGLFTYTGQHVAFVTAVVAFYLAFMFLARLRRPDRLLLVAAAPAVASLAVLTGSRSIYVVLAAMAALTAAGIAASGRVGPSLGRLAGIAATVALAGLLLVSQYGDMFAAMQRRVEAAAHAEGPPLDRIAATLTSFVAPLGDAALTGFGIGRGTPAVGTVVGTVSYEFGGESEPGRVVYELGPVLGLAFLAFRLHLFCHLMAGAVRAGRRGLLAALPLAAFAGIAILTSQLTFSALNAFLPYLAAGCVLALVRGSRAPRPDGFGPWPRPRPLHRPGFRPSGSWLPGQHPPCPAQLHRLEPRPPQPCPSQPRSAQLGLLEPCPPPPRPVQPCPAQLRSPEPCPSQPCPPQRRPAQLRPPDPCPPQPGRLAARGPA